MNNKLKRIISINFDTITQGIKHYGYSRLFIKSIYKSIGRLIELKIYHLVYLTKNNIVNISIELPSGYSRGFISDKEMEKLSADKELRWDSEFIDEIKSHGDFIYGLRKNGDLISHFCFSNKATVLYDNLYVINNKKYLYLYKAMTKRAYRGQRMIGDCIYNAINEFTGMEYAGILSLIEIVNFPSLKVAFRLGYKTGGRVLIFKIFNKWYIVHSRSCRILGVRIIEK